jgi:hypothetical protein
LSGKSKYNGVAWQNILLKVPKLEYTNVSVYNTTIYFKYIKWYIDRATCFDLHWVILRPSKKADPR